MKSNWKFVITLTDGSTIESNLYLEYKTTKEHVENSLKLEYGEDIIVNSLM